MRQSDVLNLPGYDESNVAGLVLEFKTRKVPLAPTVICMLVHTFVKYGVMGEETFN